MHVNSIADQLIRDVVKYRSLGRLSTDTNEFMFSVAVILHWSPFTSSNPSTSEDILGIQPFIFRAKGRWHIKHLEDITWSVILPLPLPTELISFVLKLRKAFSRCVTIWKPVNACCLKIDLGGRRGSPDLWFRNFTEAVSKRPSGMLNLLSDYGVWKASCPSKVFHNMFAHTTVLYID